MGTGITWALLWGALGGLYGVLLGLMNPRYWSLGNPIVDTGVGYGIWGFIAGVGFGTLLSLAEHRRSLRELSLTRVAAWGAVGGALVPVLVHLVRGLTSSAGFVEVLQAAVAAGLMGCVSAIGTVAVARRSDRDEPLVDAADSVIEAQALLSEPPPRWDDAGMKRGSHVVQDLGRGSDSS